MTDFNTFQTVKRRFFAMRNGVIADTLRKSGSPYKIIFGLNMPQLKEIAAEFVNFEGLAEKLWDNSTTRESMLLAPMLMNPTLLSTDEALLLIEESPDIECLDMLTHNLLQKMPEKEDLAKELITNDDWEKRYVAMRLAWTFLPSNPLLAQNLAKQENERNDIHTKNLAQKIITINDAL